MKNEEVVRGLYVADGKTEMYKEKHPLIDMFQAKHPMKLSNEFAYTDIDLHTGNFETVMYANNWRASEKRMLSNGVSVFRALTVDDMTAFYIRFGLQYIHEFVFNPSLTEEVRRMVLKVLERDEIKFNFYMIDGSKSNKIVCKRQVILKGEEKEQIAKLITQMLGKDNKEFIMFNTEIQRRSQAYNYDYAKSLT